MYSFRENKKILFGITALLMLVMSIVCLSIRIGKVNEVLDAVGYTGKVGPRDWAAATLSFCLVAFIMILGSVILIGKDGEFDNIKANSLFYIGLIIGIVAASITLQSAHDDYDVYVNASKILNGTYSGSSAVGAGMSWIESVGIPFIPMVISSVAQGLILIVATIVDLSGTSTTGVDMVAISQSTANRKLSDRSFVGNVNETISSFKGYIPPKKPRKKAKTVSKTVTKAKPIKELNTKQAKKTDSFDEMIKRVGRAEHLLKKGDMTQEEFDAFKAKEIAKHK